MRNSEQVLVAATIILSDATCAVMSQAVLAQSSNPSKTAGAESTSGNTTKKAGDVQASLKPLDQTTGYGAFIFNNLNRERGGTKEPPEPDT